MKEFAPEFADDVSAWVIEFLRKNKSDLEELIFRWGMYVVETKREAAEEEEQKRAADENLVEKTNQMKKRWMDDKM